MGEKTRIPAISDTILVNGVYVTEQRTGKDRRKNRAAKWRFYERRRGIDPRFTPVKKIDEEA